MRLVCFLGVTAGGLVCDLLNQIESPIDINGRVKSKHHNTFKNLTPYLDKGPFDESTWFQIIRNNNLKPFMYYGTHTHPSNIPKKYLDQFVEVVVISSTTQMCKFYKYLRFKHLYSNSPINIEACFADYPPVEGCTEIKFCDVVEGRFVKEYNLNTEHFDMWKKSNSYLYDQSFTEEFLKLYNDYNFKRTSNG